MRDLESGQDLPDEIGETAGSAVSGAHDGEWLFYTRLDENHRPRQVFRHRARYARSDDVLVYEEAGHRASSVGIGATPIGATSCISAHDHETREVRLIDAGDVDAGRVWSRAQGRKPRLFGRSP